MGIDVEAYDRMFAKQDGRCAICRKRSLRKRLTRDHDHTIERETGEYVIRGLLCNRCNQGLGRFEYSDEVLINLRNYTNKILRIRRQKLGRL